MADKVAYKSTARAFRVVIANTDGLTEVLGTCALNKAAAAARVRRNLEPGWRVVAVIG